MASRKTHSVKEREAKLIEKIEKTKQALSQLQKKRQLEIGKLACKYSLDTLDNAVLDKHFAQLAKKHVNGNP